jgi:Na+/H+ antiporter NhaC
MAILIPTAIPVAYALDGNEYALITMISLGAVLDGAIFGDHCSPISDTTIMSSIASGCDHLEHVKTQIPYSVTVALTAAFIGYVSVANGFNLLLAYFLSVMVLFLILHRSPRINYQQEINHSNG